MEHEMIESWICLFLWGHEKLYFGNNKIPYTGLMEAPRRTEIVYSPKISIQYNIIWIWDYCSVIPISTCLSIDRCRVD